MTHYTNPTIDTTLADLQGTAQKVTDAYDTATRFVQAIQQQVEDATARHVAAVKELQEVMGEAVKSLGAFGSDLLQSLIAAHQTISVAYPAEQVPLLGVVAANNPTQQEAVDPHTPPAEEPEEPSRPEEEPEHGEPVGEKAESNDICEQWKEALRPSRAACSPVDPPEEPSEQEQADAETPAEQGKPQKKPRKSRRKKT